MSASIREESRLAGKHIVENCWCDHDSHSHAWYNAGHDSSCDENCRWHHLHVHCTPCADEHRSDWSCCEPPVGSPKP